MASWCAEPQIQRRQRCNRLSCGTLRPLRTAPTLIAKLCAVIALPGSTVCVCVAPLPSMHPFAKAPLFAAPLRTGCARDVSRV